MADDDDAHWLLGEVPDEAPEPGEIADPARDDLSDARRRRLSAVPADELPLGDDAIELVREAPAPEVARDRADETAALGAEAPVEAYLDSPADTEQATLDDLDEPDDLAETDDVDGTDGADAAPEHDDPRRHEPPSRKPVKKTRGRASVPSWDEIMFGGESTSE